MNSIAVISSAALGAKNIPSALKPSRKIELDLRQMCFDFEANAEVMGSIAAEQVSSTPDLLGLPVSFAGGGISPDISFTASQGETSDGVEAFVAHDRYMHFALDMLLTCAEDLVRADEMTQKHPNDREVGIQARLLRTQTKIWLEERTHFGNLGRDDLESVFSFKDCMELLEDELRIQSLGQIDVPAIADRRAEMADFILADPHNARNILKTYKGIFKASEDVDFEDADEFQAHSDSQRRRERAGA